MDLKNEIIELEKELNKSKAIKKYDKSKNGSKSIFWENQAHAMQINKSILETNVRPFLFKLLTYSEKVDKILLENKRLNKELIQTEQLLNVELEHKRNLSIELEKTKKKLHISKSRNKKNRDNVFKPYSSNKNHARGGCKLTDKQIERLLLIYAKRGKYASMSLNQAINTIAQTKNTYYKVIKLDYQLEDTRERIRAIARKNDICLENDLKCLRNKRG